MTCAQGLLRLLWGGARSWSATGLSSHFTSFNSSVSVLMAFGEPLVIFAYIAICEFNFKIKHCIVFSEEGHAILRI